MLLTSVMKQQKEETKITIKSSAHLLLRSIKIDLIKLQSIRIT